MRVHVDMDLCESHGICTYTAPSVFELDDDDVLQYVERPDPGMRAQVEEAAKGCPAGAISLIDD
jgi:ferredoxin